MHQVCQWLCHLLQACALYESGCWTVENPFRCGVFPARPQWLIICLPFFPYLLDLDPNNLPHIYFLQTNSLWSSVCRIYHDDWGGTQVNVCTSFQKPLPLEASTLETKWSTYRGRFYFIAFLFFIHYVQINKPKVRLLAIRNFLEHTNWKLTCSIFNISRTSLHRFVMQHKKGCSLEPVQKRQPPRFTVQHRQYITKIATSKHYMNVAAMIKSFHRKFVMAISSRTIRSRTYPYIWIISFSMWMPPTVAYSTYKTAIDTLFLKHRKYDL